MNKGELERLHIYRNKTEWKVVKNKKNCGVGYCVVNFNGRQIYYHSIVWMLYNKKDIPANLEIDHINGNKIDNRIDNLRLVTHRKNLQNEKIHREGQLFGCYFNKSKGKYQAQIGIGEKRVFLGRYKTEQETHKAYEIACKYIAKYVDNDSFRELVKNEMEGSRVGNNELAG